jgi:hypothetical protein
MYFYSINNLGAHQLKYKYYEGFFVEALGITVCLNDQVTMFKCYIWRYIVKVTIITVIFEQIFRSGPKRKKFIIRNIA